MEYPSKIMANVLWNFDEDIFVSIKEFEQAVLAYNQLIKGSVDHLDLYTVVLKSSEVVIQYTHWDKDEDGDEEMYEPDFLLQADNGKSFTAIELLFKVHSKVCQKLKHEDKKYFEGFEYYEFDNPNYPDVPLYFLNQGS